MSNFPGLGVMISHLGGNAESVAAIKAAFGKTIASAECSERALRLRFTDGTAIEFYDDGQSCCESRYMRTDDDIGGYEGAILADAEIRDAPSIADQYGEHEVQFLVVGTSKGAITVAAHNEHNGYYGGFSLRVRNVK